MAFFIFIFMAIQESYSVNPKRVRDDHDQRLWFDTPNLMKAGPWLLNGLNCWGQLAKGPVSSWRLEVITCLESFLFVESSPFLLLLLHFLSLFLFPFSFSFFLIPLCLLETYEQKMEKENMFIGCI